MFAYIVRRLLLIIPTLVIILLVNFVIVQAAPGGPVEQAIAHLQGIGGGGVGGSAGDGVSSGSRASRGLDPKLIKDIEKQYGFDKSAPERLWLMLKNYAQLDFGNSFFRGATVIDLILEKLPVTLSLGLWATLITYLVSIPLGIRKAVRHGSSFDVWSSTAIVIGYAMPAFLFAMFLIVVFAGGSTLNWFPVRDLVSENFEQLSTLGKIADYFWHLVLPVSALVIGGFATLTTLYRLPSIGEPLTLHTHLVVREDAQLLYGFIGKRERDFFRELIRLNGVGPKLALALMSSLEVDELVRCVQAQDTSALTKVPGVGKKTAERLLVELKDRFKAWEQVPSMFALVPNQPDAPVPVASAESDAVSALISLGYKPQEASKAVSAIKDKTLSSEDMIRRALKGMI